MFFPEGVTLTVSPSVTHLSKNLWGPDAQEFRPERWFAPDAAAKEKYFIPVRSHVSFRRIYIFHQLISLIVGSGIRIMPWTAYSQDPALQDIGDYCEGFQHQAGRSQPGVEVVGLLHSCPS
jgi:hypothetical protein